MQNKLPSKVGKYPIVGLEFRIVLCLLLKGESGVVFN